MNNNGQNGWSEMATDYAKGLGEWFIIALICCIIAGIFLSAGSGGGSDDGPELEGWEYDEVGR